MPYSDSAPRRQRPEPRVVIDPVITTDQATVNFNNPTSRPVEFVVEGVIPKGLVIGLNGNTFWRTEVFSDKTSGSIVVRIRDTREVVAAISLDD